MKIYGRSWGREHITAYHAEDKVRNCLNKIKKAKKFYKPFAENTAITNDLTIGDMIETLVAAEKFIDAHKGEV